MLTRLNILLRTVRFLPVLTLATAYGGMMRTWPKPANGTRLCPPYLVVSLATVGDALLQGVSGLPAV